MQIKVIFSGININCLKYAYIDIYRSLMCNSFLLNTKITKVTSVIQQNPKMLDKIFLKMILTFRSWKIGKILQFRIDETQNKYMGLYKYIWEIKREHGTVLCLHAYTWKLTMFLNNYFSITINFNIVCNLLDMLTFNTD